MERVKELENEILRHKALYYQGRPEISDAAYDQLEQELRELNPSSKILELVGSVSSGQGKVRHSPKMLSLAKTYSKQDLQKWIGDHKVASVQKIDGVSCSLLYKDAAFELAKTRGDGTFGEDISAKVAWISSVPKSVPSELSFEVRGEIYCTGDDFYLLAQEMQQLGLEAPTSQRNIVAGLMGRKDNIELCRYLKFFAFDYLAKQDPLKTEAEKHKKLAKLGLSLPPHSYHSDFETLEREIDKAQAFMADGDYLIDGLVISYNETELHSEMGSTAHHPRYRMAFKFQGQSKQTIIEAIEWSVSRNGVLTPVANVKPVELSGASIARVTLHNYGVVKQFKLKKGDTIEIVRSGEVIPKFLAKLTSSRSKYVVPSKCPSCGKKLTEELIRLRCKNEQCPQQIQDTILNFIQKIGIDDLSSKRLEELIKQKLVLSIADLYKLKADDLLKMDKVKDKLAGKVLGNIEQSKKVDLTTFLSALGLTGGAYSKCEKVVQHGFDSLEKVKKLTVEQLVEVESFAEKSATEFIQSLQKKLGLIKELEKLGFAFRAEKQSKRGELAGLKVVITGALSRKRSEIEKMIKQQGGSTSSSVSKATDYLVTNETDSKSSKFKKAKQLGVKIISEEKLYQLMQGK